jgi:two-component system chemotaxis response regulator CheB
MDAARIVVIGASAGGVDALKTIVAGLPADFPAPVLVVVHVPASGKSVLPQVLARSGPLPASHAQDGDEPKAGQILIAPPDRHLVLSDGRVRLRRGPHENTQRPAVDPLFVSVARAVGPRAIGVVLSGALDDGAVGVAAIAAQDGTVVVQDPDDARVSGMPRAALRAVRRAIPLPAEDIPSMLVDLTRAPTPTTTAVLDADTVLEDRMAQSEGQTLGVPNEPAALGCPECDGGMFESQASGVLHYACYVGHSWSPQTLLEAQRHSVEAALYNAASKLREIAAVHRRLAELRTGRDDAGSEHHRTHHLETAERAERISTQIVSEIVSGPDATSVFEPPEDEPNETADDIAG